MFLERIKNEKSGMTLIEMIVAVSIFTAMIFMTSNVFISVMSGQRRSIAQQNTQENMRYVYEVFGKEIRQAQRSDDACYGLALNRNYNTNASNSILYFRNKAGECVSYFVSDGTLMVRRGARLASTTPSFLTISGLHFEVVDNRIAPGSEDRVQPRVTFKMKAEASDSAYGDIDLYMQTTISSRYYE
jgi:prepilin-type N-terminal cleavage/methylation domain-containing protein